MTPGTKLGPYEIVAQIGAGGMGEVYRARDPRLGRDVAIKVSAERFSERFEREARAIAALNHPNICTLFDVGPNYLVMELIEGEPPKGPLPLEEALRIAAQIADALEAAHERGIVHRDLKPGNIKVKPDGAVKVLDFGLAKVAESQAEARATDSPTLTMAGVVMGTAAYMSPEQARGKPVDKRSDIWAFGVVLYEMLTGEQMFRGETVSDTLAQVLTKEPAWNRVPAKAQRLLKACLERDPKRRLRDIGEAWRLLEDSPEPPTAAPSLSWLGIAGWGVAVAMAGLAWWAPWRTPPAAPERVRLQLLPSENLSTSVAHALSPDGRKLAYPAIGADGVTRLWIRDLDSLEAHALPGVQLRSDPPPPFWSPDSRSIAFDSDRGLQRADISGGPAQSLWDGFAIGGAWNRDGTIIFGIATRLGGLMRVSAGGGTASRITSADHSSRGTQHTYPVFMPDGRHFLYLQTSDQPQDTGIFSGSLDDPPERQNSKRVLATDFAVTYVPSLDSKHGHLLFLRDAKLMAQPFDAGQLQSSGEPVEVADQVGSYVTFGFFSASSNCRLVYRTGGTNSRLTWLDREGKVLGAIGEAGRFAEAAISPKGTQAVVARGDVRNRDLWLLDFARDSSTRFTFGPWAANFPVWSPDGASLIYTTSPDGASFGLYRKPASGAGDPQLLSKAGSFSIPTSWSRDGRFLLYTEIDPKTKNDIWVLPLTGSGDAKPSRLVGTEFNEEQARFSPDDRRIAYVSDESGRNEVYVREFSLNSTGGKLLVSKGGGSAPRWRGDGGELFYLAPDGMVMAAEVGAGSPFQSGAPKPLYRMPAGATPGDVSADGKRFLVGVPVQQSAQTPFTVVLNWQAGLKK